MGIHAGHEIGGGAMSNESLADTIIPKSDQLNADDLIAGPITVTVEGVKRSPSPEQPIDILISGHRPYRPCKSMRRVLISVWGDKGADWIGKSMTLYRDESVKYGGVAVGGIRISHVTDIDKRRDLMLTSTRTKREMYTVNPLILKASPCPADYKDQIKLFSNTGELRDWMMKILNKNGWDKGHPFRQEFIDDCSKQVAAIDHINKVDDQDEIQSSDDFDAGLGEIEE